jgi:hypothetical protein
MHFFMIGYPITVFLAMLGVIAWQFDFSGIDWPAWVQAVGSIAAILVAIIIANHQQRVRRVDAERLDKIKATVAATRIIFDLAHAISALEEVIKWCHGVESDDPEPQSVEAYMGVINNFSFDPSREILLDLAPLPNDCAFRLAAGVGYLRVAQLTTPTLYRTYNFSGQAGRNERKKITLSLVGMLMQCHKSFVAAFEECSHTSARYARAE